MNMRTVEKKDFEGKTVAEVDCGAVNCLNFKFTDGTSLEIETERMDGGIYGIVVIEEEEKKNAKGQ